MATLIHEKTPTAIPAKCMRWMKRIGLIGFLFFLIKGLLWLLIPALLYYFNAN